MTSRLSEGWRNGSSRLCAGLDLNCPKYVHAIWVPDCFILSVVKDGQIVKMDRRGIEE
jgi:hypothetical protein